MAYPAKDVQAAIKAARKDHPEWPRYWWVHGDDPMTIRRLESAGYLPLAQERARYALIVAEQTAKAAAMLAEREARGDIGAAEDEAWDLHEAAAARLEEAEAQAWEVELWRRHEATMAELAAVKAGTVRRLHAPARRPWEDPVPLAQVLAFPGTGDGPAAS